MEIQEQHGLDARIHAPSPWISRCFSSNLLPDSNHNEDNSEYISTTPKEIYGNPSHPIAFNLGNGGAGYTGLLKLLCETYITETASEIRISWISNHSRHSQLALLAGVVHVALTYEPENEDLSIREGWAERVCRVFNDHFLLAGPVDVDLPQGDGGIEGAFRCIAQSHTEPSGGRYAFHSRGDGSATFTKEQKIWNAAGLDVGSMDWIETYPLVPYEALRKAEQGSAFLLTDRSTYLTAKRDGIIPSLQVHVEGGEELMNPCSALVASAELIDRFGEGKESHAAAREFAAWLDGERAQERIRRCGIDWPVGMALFTQGSKDEFDEQDGLVGRC